MKINKFKLLLNECEYLFEVKEEKIHNIDVRLIEHFGKDIILFFEWLEANYVDYHIEQC